MSFLKPVDYKAAEDVNIKINGKSLENLECRDKDAIYLDFGCGSGATTAALARGELTRVKPGRVIGADINPDMIEVCKKRYGEIENLTFMTLDVDDNQQRDRFLAEWDGKISVFTSFFCLHYMVDMPCLVSLVKRCLKPGGQFICLVPFVDPMLPGSYSTIIKKMISHHNWPEALRTFRMRFGTDPIINKAWMKRSENALVMDDLKDLLIDNGFRVHDCSSLVYPNHEVSVLFVKSFAKLGAGFKGLDQADEIAEEFIRLIDQMMEANDEDIKHWTFFEIKASTVE